MTPNFRNPLPLALHVLKARAAFAGHGVQLGRRARVTSKRPRISNSGVMTIGANVRIHGRQFPVALSTGSSGRLQVGSRVMINQGATIHAESLVEIGDDVMISDLVAIYDTHFHAVDEDVAAERAPVIIERNVWIGRGAIVLPGTRVGAHSVIAAGAIVTQDVPERTLVAGNPARVLRAVGASDTFRRW